MPAEMPPPATDEAIAALKDRAELLYRHGNRKAPIDLLLVLRLIARIEQQQEQIHSAAGHNLDREWEKYEPDDFALMKVNRRPHRIGDRVVDVGFCFNSPGGGGYSDEKIIWIRDTVSDPHTVIEFCIHEGLHAIFPELTEEKVDESAKQISLIVEMIFKAKRVKISKLAPILTKENHKKYFPGSVWNEDQSKCQITLPDHIGDTTEMIPDRETKV